ncbi:MAG: hypothetical protein WBL44_06515 [Nitrososphaeraceae archaeon]|jgi:hypothetical protein
MEKEYKNRIRHVKERFEPLEKTGRPVRNWDGLSRCNGSPSRYTE